MLWISPRRQSPYIKNAHAIPLGLLRFTVRASFHERRIQKCWFHRFGSTGSLKNTKIDPLGTTYCVGNGFLEKYPINYSYLRMINHSDIGLMFTNLVIERGPPHCIRYHDKYTSNLQSPMCRHFFSSTYCRDDDPPGMMFSQPKVDGETTADLWNNRAATLRKAVFFIGKSMFVREYLTRFFWINYRHSEYLMTKADYYGWLYVMDNQ